MKTHYLILNRVIYILLLILILNPDIKPQSVIAHPEKIFTYKDSFIDGANHSQMKIELLDNYDVKCYMLDLNVSKSSTEISGSGTIYALVQDIPLDTFAIELIDNLAATTYMIVDSVKINGAYVNFIHNNNMVRAAIDPPLPVGSFLTAIIYYHGNGQGIEATGYNGISNGSEFGSSVTLTYSEPFWSYVWWPCKQILSDKADSVQISITTDADCKAGSNGILKSVIPLPGDKIRYVWKSNYPIAYYLISFAVGQYIEDISYAPLNGGTDSVMIQSYLFQNCPFLSRQMIAIQKTKKFIQLFGDLFGTYPFAGEKYGYCLDVGPWGAMEHQTMTTIGYLALDTTAGHIGNYYYWYSAHELAHSWFGDNVTCATWQDVWLNEGFASYGEYLALQNLESQVSANYWMNDAQQLVKSLPGGSVYIPYDFINDEYMIFDYRLTYKKGAAILHILRYEVGNDSLFFMTLRNFQNEYDDSVATGLDFKNVLEQTTGQDFTDFFNQWYFGEGYPIFDMTWTQTDDTLKIHSVQTTSTQITTLFKMHLELKLFYPGGDTLIKIYQQSNDQYFEIYIPHLISTIWIDPDHWYIFNSTTHHTDVIDNYKPESFCLYQNFPNPFNPSTKIKFHIPHFSRAQLKIFDVLGNEVGKLVDAEKPAGEYEIEFDGSLLPSGVYFYQLRSGLFNATKKMILLR